MTEPSAFAYGGPAPAPVAQQNILDRIKARTVETVKAETVLLPVEMRDGFAVAYSRYLSEPQWDVFGLAHAGDQSKFLRAVMAAQAKSVLVDGETWLGTDGEPLTFTSSELWSAFDVGNAFDAITALYIRPPDVLIAGMAVCRYCGWDLGKQMDPTQP